MLINSMYGIADVEAFASHEVIVEEYYYVLNFKLASKIIKRIIKEEIG